MSDYMHPAFESEPESSSPYEAQRRKPQKSSKHDLKRIFSDFLRRSKSTNSLRNTPAADSEVEPLPCLTISAPNNLVPSIRESSRRDGGIEESAGPQSYIQERMLPPGVLQQQLKKTSTSGDAVWAKSAPRPSLTPRPPPRRPHKEASSGSDSDQFLPEALTRVTRHPVALPHHGERGSQSIARRAELESINAERYFKSQRHASECYHSSHVDEVGSEASSVDHPIPRKLAEHLNRVTFGHPPLSPSNSTGSEAQRLLSSKNDLPIISPMSPLNVEFSSGRRGLFEPQARSCRYDRARW